MPLPSVLPKFSNLLELELLCLSLNAYGYGDDGVVVKGENCLIKLLLTPYKPDSIW